MGGLMPKRAAKLCKHPTCSTLVRGVPRCTVHARRKRTRDQRTDRRRRGSSAERGYDARHRKWRRLVLNKHPLCVHCLDEGKTTPATVADHIVPWQDGGAKLDVDNGQGLCAACHNRKTAKERAA